MPRRRTIRITSLATMLLWLLAPNAAFAHQGHAVTESLVAGLLHPLTGLDHVLMIVAVSAWASLLAPHGRVVVAAALALFVGIGALLPVGGSSALEIAIALTVVGAGVLLAVGRRWHLWATSVLAAGFALIHGFAHGAEGPGRSSAYIVGLMLATALLAVVISFAAARLQRHPLWLRAAGVASAATGAVALAS